MARITAFTNRTTRIRHRKSKKGLQKEEKKAYIDVPPAMKMIMKK